MAANPTLPPQTPAKRAAPLPVALLGSLLLSACSAFGIRSGTEEPRHSVVERLDNVEIRRYAPRLAAETVVPGDAFNARGEGFRRLAGYIFGATRAAAAST